MKVEEIDSLITIGINAHGENPASAIKYFSVAGKQYLAIDSFNRAGNAFLNVANIFEEHTKHADSALIFARMSLENYRIAADSMQIANLNKYYGYLLGTNGSIAEGQKYINQASDYYRRVGFREGLAVCNFNSARLAVLDSHYVKADSLLNKVKEVLDPNKDVMRLLTIYMVEMEIAIARSDKRKLLQNIVKCDSILLQNEVPMILQKRYKDLRAQL